ncbi:hypothetical protein BBO99_00003629 [Phytophthora kernoviae]|uniref:Calponin-homology (CH) domain-containing protein n=2 Tax=Phytophthora kernoviae TaxID=325452 RepID=A0A3R7K1I6_9STRA|nr:hypothetical protein G195_005021 [Phytophthora kernoviae 00238/432]KAG2524733.1 hypothetical protein JM16_004821 [Phytophthora kernoviae]RLN02168.1 hypothetical protein BBI17_002341 [Phytophthora kernoviae]RLN81544.1 hypothetical protein BBO99_00003629 [Phytophthora kernoviae]
MSNDFSLRANIQDPSAKLVEFQSGVLLCCIVEKVEYMRSIPGITRPSSKQQLSKASALHNIAKALDMLKQKKVGLPVHHVTFVTHSHDL